MQFCFYRLYRCWFLSQAVARPLLAGDSSMASRCPRLALTLTSMPPPSWGFRSLLSMIPWSTMTRRRRILSPVWQSAGRSLTALWSMMGEIPPQDAARLETNDDFRVEAVAPPGVPLMFLLNTTRAPLDDISVRQALLYATDRSAIASAVFHDTSPAAYGPLTAGTLGYDPAVQGYYAHDPARAAALLEEAGWTDSDGDGLRDREGEPLMLDLYLMGWGYMPEVGQLLAAQWMELGIGVNSQIVSYPEALEVGGEGRHHLMPFSLSSSDPDLLRKFFHSQATFNWAKVNDPELDAWLEEAARASDHTQRAPCGGAPLRRPGLVPLAD